MNEKSLVKSAPVASFTICVVYLVQILLTQKFHYHFNSTDLLTAKSLLKLAHAMTALLSWYLLIFMMITFAENEQNGIDFDFELEISWAMQVPELGHEEKVWQRFVYKNLKINYLNWKCLSFLADQQTMKVLFETWVKIWIVRNHLDLIQNLRINRMLWSCVEFFFIGTRAI